MMGLAGRGELATRLHRPRLVRRDPRRDRVRRVDAG